jgi:Fic family protein
MDKNYEKRIETLCSGFFKLQLGLSRDAIKLPLQRVIDAQVRFRSSPLSSVASSLEQEVVVSSIFGTNSIEGGTLNVKETEQVLTLSPKDIQTIHQRRVVNIKNAYDFIRDVASQADWHPSLSDVCRIHALVSSGLELEESRNKPGILRDNPDGVITRVGSDEHGGVYKPPQLGLDIQLLLSTLLDWNRELVAAGVPALIRAPLVHLYFELIHPFWDGNGRVGRVLEAGILHADGFQYSPFAQAGYYFKNLHQYFALFNHCRKESTKKHENPNQAFVQFFLDGMLETINHLHTRVNDLVRVALFDAKLKHLKDDKTFNNRQYAIVNAILNHSTPLTTSQLKQLPWFVALYDKLTDKTKSRDIIKLKALKLITEKDGILTICF